jgi:hypothetical protein
VVQPECYRAISKGAPAAFAESSGIYTLGSGGPGPRDWLKANLAWCASERSYSMMPAAISRL